MQHTNTDKTLQKHELPEYDFRGIEAKWQNSWEKEQFQLPYGETRIPSIYCDNYGYVPGPETRVIIFMPEIGSPDDIIKDYGIDAMRFCILSMSPKKCFEWHNESVHESAQYLKWIWITGNKHIEMILDAMHASYSPQTNNKRDKLLFSKLNETIKIANNDIEEYFFHNIANGLRELSNDLHNYLYFNDPNEKLVGTVIFNMITILSVFCPFICEELWQRFGYKNSIFEHPWPSIVNKALEKEKLSIPVRINGMLQRLLQVPIDTAKDNAMLTNYVLEHPVIRFRLADREISKVITTPDNEINIVTG